jgi:hypothetical protein
MFRTLAAAAIAAVLALPALADEVWALPSGNQITYLSDEGTTAVLGYTPVIGVEQSYIFVPGLGGNYDNRGTLPATGSSRPMSARPARPPSSPPTACRGNAGASSS